MTISLAGCVLAEFLGTASLVAAAIGSGIMGERPRGFSASIVSSAAIHSRLV
jgi:hypothetical protein